MNEVISPKGTRSLQLDMLAILIFPCISAWYFYGTAALKLIVVSVVTAFLCELVGRLLMDQDSTVGDLSAVVHGIILALMLPAGSPLWLAVIGSSFTVIVGKLPFGSPAYLPFSPPAAGMAFLTICFPNMIFDYPAIEATAFLSGSSGSSLASLLAQNTSINLSSVKAIDIFTGNYPGPMGAGCIIILLGSSLYMLIRRSKLFISVAGFITGAALMAVCFPRVTNLLSSIVLELAAGYMIFAALFLLTEHSTQPAHPVSRLLYGFFAGIMCMLMRRFGAFEECACFGILIINAVWNAVDRQLTKLMDKKLTKGVKKHE